MERFEALGFHLEFETSPESLVVEMVDEEANYGHSGHMPANIPYTASNGAGSNYGDGKMACDGREFIEIAANNDGFVVDWDYKKSQPTKQSLQNIRQFIRIEQRAGKIIKALRQKEPHKHVFSPHTNLCNYCGIHADDDAVQDSRCPI
jgi:hypothetical protein